LEVSFVFVSLIMWHCVKGETVRVLNDKSEGGGGERRKYSKWTSKKL